VATFSAFRRGLAEIGYAEGRNVGIEYRFADGQYDRLPAHFAELTGRHVAVLVIVGSVAALGDDGLRLLRSSQIPIVFNIGGDPVRNGLVASYNHPGGNMTGISTLVGSATTKHMGLLHELVPSAKTIALLTGLPSTDAMERGRIRLQDEAREAAARLGLQLLVFNAPTEGEIEAAFAAMNQQRAEALVVFTSPFFVTRAKLIASLAGGYRVPAIYPRREFAEAGGLMSYGYDVVDGYRRLGGYAGRILKGEKAGDLPVFQPTKFELVINLKTAKALRFEIPVKVLALADEVIE
jgi:putative ABC transport system substrate-binding protein